MWSVVSCLLIPARVCANRWRQGILLAVIVLGVPAALAAQDEPRRVRITDVSFTGVSAVEVSALAGTLATREGSRWPWGKRAYFSNSALRQDFERIRAFYRQRGYPDGRVETYDVVATDDGDGVAITFHVAEGEPVRIGSIEGFGFEVLPQVARRLVRDQAQISRGMIRDLAAVERARDLAQNALREEGYPYARVSVLEAPGAEPHTVALTFAAEPGPAAVFGPLTIAGQRTVGEDVIRRQLAFGPGDPFKLSRVLESQRRLYTLELFDFVNFDVPDPATQPTEVPVKLSVTEGRHHRVQFGVGYGTEEHARVTSRVRNVNFLGGARTAGLEAKWSSLDRGVRLELTEPYFFSPSYQLDVQVQQWYGNEPAYDLVTRGGRATVRREIVRRDAYGRRRSSTRASLSFIDEFERYTIDEDALADPTFRDDLIALGLDPETRAGRGTLVALGLDVTHDTTDSLLDARRGFLASLHLEQSGRVLGGDWQYSEITFDTRHYLAVGRLGVLAGKVRVGGIMAAGDTGEDVDPLGVRNRNVPFFKRYYLGGSTTLRGWGRYQVSPLNAAGFPIGGLGLLEVTAEFRFPIRGRLSGVVFGDAGNVTARAWRRALITDLKTDAGAGVRYATPIGPVRFDVGYQLDPIPGLLIDGEPQKRRWRLHVSVGQAF